jgi:SAM-dependent methyltransferase
MGVWIPPDNRPAPLADPPVELLADSYGQMSFGERAALEGLLSQLRPGISLEIGTYDGGSLRRIAAHSDHVHTIDLYDVIEDRSVFTNVTFHMGDSRQLVPQLLDDLHRAGSHVDFVLIDGDHSAAGVRTDLQHVVDAPAARRAVILLHDTMNAETRSGIEQVDLAARPQVVYVELDFIPGYEFRGGHFDGQVWGGLGLVVTGEQRAATYAESPVQTRYAVPFAERRAREHERVALEGLNAELSATRADRDRHREALRGIQASVSWRITRPLRAAKAWMRRSGAGVPAQGTQCCRSRASETKPVADVEQQRSRWFWEHYDDAATQIVEFLDAEGISLTGKQVADVGCGDGIIDLGVVHKAKPSRLVGFDVNPTDVEYLLAEAKREAVAVALPRGLEFSECEPAQLPAPSESFDIVVSWSAFEHVADPAAVVGEIRRILRPPGVFMLQLWPFFHSANGSHLWDWFPEKFVQLLRSNKEIEEAVRANPGPDVDGAEYMLREYLNLNRVTIDGLHAALRGQGFRVARLELISGPVQLPVELADQPLWLLGISGVKLLAVPDQGVVGSPLA